MIFSTALLLVHYASASLAPAEFAHKPHHLANAIAGFFGYVVLLSQAPRWLRLFFDMQNSTVEERVLEPIASGEEIAWLMFEFQIYTIVAWSLQVLQERKLTTESLVYLGHHAFTFVLAGAGIRYTFNHYYAGFFFCIIEISTIPLLGVDLFKTFPSLAERYPVSKQVCRVVFAASFLIVRVIFWLPMSYCFWSDTVAAYLGTSGVRGSRAGESWTNILSMLVQPLPVAKVPSYAFFLFWIANVFLTCLQLYWASLIVGAIVGKKKKTARRQRRDL